jgi:transcriptional regulator with XRE-family HTH domain
MKKQTTKKESLRLRFADKMRLARQMLRISQDELADRCGLHRSYIGSVERGERNLSVDNMEVIANALDRDICDLLTLGEPRS